MLAEKQLSQCTWRHSSMWQRCRGAVVAAPRRCCGARAARPGARRGRALSHHMTLCPRRALARRRARCVLRGQPFVSVLGNLVDLNVSGRRARQEPLTGLQNTRKVLSLCPLTMAYSWSGALGPRVVPRAAHDVNSCLSVLSGLGVARMGRLACVFRALLCWRRCARDWLQSLGGL